MQSSIFKFFANIFHTLAFWFDASLTGRVFNSISAFCARVFRHSVLGKFFCAKESAGWFTESIFCKLLLLPVSFLRYLNKKAGETLRRISSSSYIIWLSENWHNISIRTYGITLCCFCVFYTVFRFLFAEPGMWEHVAVGALGLLSLLAIGINRSCKSLFKGSLLMQLIGGLFGDIKKDTDSKLFFKEPENISTHPVTGLIAGFVLACITSFMPPFMALVLCGGLVGLFLCLKSTTFCVFAVILAAPVLPTMLLAGLCVLSACSLALRLITNKDFTLRPVPLGGYILFFALALGVSCLNSFTFIKSMQILFIYLAFILFYFVAYQTLDTPQKWRAAVVSFLLMAGLVALYGVYQNFAGVSSTQSWVDAEMFKNIKVRVYSTFDNPNVLGEFLVLLIPVSLAVLWKARTDGQKLVYAGIFAILAACLVFTWSRGAWLGVMLAVALYFIVMDKRWSLLAMIGICMIPFFLASGSAIAERILSIGNTADTSTAYRVSIWRAAVTMIQDFWLGGVGSGSDAFSMIYPKYALAGANYALHSHNLFLQLWVETGITGIVAFLVLMLSFFKKSFSLSVYQNRSGSDAALCLAMGFGVLGFLFQGLTDNVWYNYKMVLIFWIMLALASSATAPDFNGGDRM
ncbi:MAG: O-antigen ligase family protein [Clostridia bacterium]|nr:O-antigen ligase family protein [Clostridia bacterium]